MVATTQVIPLDKPNIGYFISNKDRDIAAICKVVFHFPQIPTDTDSLFPIAVIHSLQADTNISRETIRLVHMGNKIPQFIGNRIQE